MRCLIFFSFFFIALKKASTEKFCNKRESCLWILYVGRIIIMVVASFLNIQTPFRLGHGHGALLIVNFPALNSTCLRRSARFHISTFSIFPASLLRCFLTRLWRHSAAHMCVAHVMVVDFKEVRASSVSEDPKREVKIFGQEIITIVIYIYNFPSCLLDTLTKKLCHKKGFHHHYHRRGGRWGTTMSLLSLVSYTHSVLYTTFCFFFSLFCGHILNGYSCVIVWMAVGRQ